MTSAPQGPSYDRGGLAAVLPSVAAALGVAPAELGRDADGLLPLAPSRSAVVVLVDGLGDELLRRRGGHAPFLRSLLADGRRLTAGFPTTTATSMATFGTGRPPGAHGLVGYEVLIPGADRIFNELSWKDGPEPHVWQPHRTIFESAAAAGIHVTRVGPRFFDGSGLTESALRGGTFLAGSTFADRVDATLSVLRRPGGHLVYLYWGDIDKIGHEHGCASWQWGNELEAVDAELHRLARSLPAGTALHVTADHGMIDAPFETRLDVAHEPVLAAGVRHVGGEPRSPQLYCEHGAADDVRAAWAQTLGEDAFVSTREEVADLGWFGGLEDRVRPRIGDVVVAMRGARAVVDSRVHRPQVLRLLGVHGSLSLDEVSVPLLSVPAR